MPPTARIKGVGKGYFLGSAHKTYHCWKSSEYKTKHYCASHKCRLPQGSEITGSGWCHFRMLPDRLPGFWRKPAWINPIIQSGIQLFRPRTHEYSEMSALFAFTSSTSVTKTPLNGVKLILLRCRKNRRF